MIRAAVFVACSSLLAACSSKLPQFPQDRYRSTRHLVVGMSDFMFGVTPVAGREVDPDPRADPSAWQHHGESAAAPPGPFGVVNVDVGDPEGKMIAHLTDVDDSAPFYLDDSVSRVLIPHVSSSGELTSQFYTYERHGWHGLPSSLTPVGPRLKRVARRTLTGWDLSPGPKYVYSIIVPGSRTGLEVPLTRVGKPISLPAGALGALAIDASKLGWTAWLVRWPNGWSLSRDPLMADHPSGARWSNVVARTLPAGTVYLGKRIEGGCEALAYAARDGNFVLPTPQVAATCDDAVATVEGEVRRLRAQIDAAIAKRDEDIKHEAIVKAAVEVAFRERWNKKQEDARAEYLEDIKDHRFVCGSSGRGMDSNVQARLVLSRFDAKDFSFDEVRCVIHMAMFPELRDELFAELDKRGLRPQLTPEANARAVRYEGTGFAPTQRTEPSNEAYMKAVNDYMYGSGRASSCPFKDQSYC